MKETYERFSTLYPFTVDGSHLSDNIYEAISQERERHDQELEHSKGISAYTKEDAFTSALDFVQDAYDKAPMYKESAEPEIQL